MAFVNTKAGVTVIGVFALIVCIHVILSDDDYLKAIQGGLNENASIASNASMVFDALCTCKKNVVVNDNDLNAESKCGEFATIRGRGQRVVSFSLFGGDRHKYTEDLVISIEAVKKYYPGYVFRLYTNMSREVEGKRYEVDTICAIACQYDFVDVCPVDALRLPDGQPMNTTSGSVWRFYAMLDPLVDEWHSRDLDSRIDEREAEAVRDWRDKTKAAFHAMRDHPYHTVPMMAGMFGMRLLDEYKDALAASFSEMTTAANFTSPKGIDQIVLERHLWKVVLKDIVVHASYHCRMAPEEKHRAFPTRRRESGNTYRNYVGSDGHDYDVIPTRFPVCPEVCRPTNHKDWLYC